MTIKKRVENAINKQINAEFYSAYLYLAMNAYFETKNFKGFANWMNAQAQEEITHALKLYNYLLERGGIPILPEIKRPKQTWTKPLKVFEDAYKHETEVTEMIDSLVTVAEKEKDRATVSMLQWFVDEQVEEESSAQEIVEKLKMAKSPESLLMIDKELATRAQVYIPQPSAEEK